MRGISIAVDDVVPWRQCLYFSNFVLEFFGFFLFLSFFFILLAPPSWLIFNIICLTVTSILALALDLALALALSVVKRQIVVLCC